MAKLLDSQISSLGVQTRFHKEGGALVIERVQDVEAILEDNKRLQNADTYSGGHFGHRPFYKVASVPLVVLEQWMKEGINPLDKNDAEKIKAKLNDPDFKFLKTTAARI